MYMKMEKGSKTTDCQVNYEEANGHLEQKLHLKNYWILTVLCLFMLMTILLFRQFNLYVPKSYSILNQPKDYIRILETNTNDTFQVCFKCTRIRNTNSYANFKKHIVSEKNGICCVNDIPDVLDNLLQELERIPPPFLQRFGTVTRRREEFNVNTTRLNTTQEREEAVSDGPSRDPEYVREKAALHLKGTYNTTSRKMTWYNIAAPSALTLSLDLTEVIIATSGNYYMYASIQYTTKMTRSRYYSVYQKSPHGVSQIDIVQDMSNETDGQQLFSMQRVVYLTRGDRIFIHFSPEQIAFVSTDEDVHVWGMFEV